MKYDGIEIPTTHDGAVDYDMLHLCWLEADAAGADERYKGWLVTFKETMANKGKWFPIVHQALVDFLKKPIYQTQWLPLTTVTDMIYGGLLVEGAIEIGKSAGMKELIAEYLESQCGVATPTATCLLFAEGTRRGKGQRITFRLNPTYRQGIVDAPSSADLAAAKAAEAKAAAELPAAGNELPPGDAN